MLFFLCLFIIAVSRAQYPGYNKTDNQSAFRQEFSNASAKTQSIKSDFVQEKNLSMLSEKIVSKGKFWFKKENLVRMEYQQPFQYLMIINKSNVYVKDGQKENKISTASSKLFAQINNIVIDCVKGTILQSADFSVRLFENEKTFLVELTPEKKALKDYFKNINIVVLRAGYSVSAIELREASGDYTRINFVNKELNVNIPDVLFAIN